MECKAKGLKSLPVKQDTMMRTATYVKSNAQIFARGQRKLLMQCRLAASFSSSAVYLCADQGCVGIICNRQRSNMCMRFACKELCTRTETAAFSDGFDDAWTCF